MTADLGGSHTVRHPRSVTEIPHRTWTVILPHHAQAPVVARRSAGEVLRYWGLGGVEETALLVISELVTNAVLHAHADGSSPELHLHAGSAWLRIEVHDTDPRPPQPRAPVGLDETGRGLLLIEAITDRWGVYATATGKAVWAALLLSR